MIHPNKGKNVGLRFVSDSGAFVALIMDEDTAKEIIRKFARREFPDPMLCDDKMGWTVDLQKVWAIHLMEIQQQNQQQQEQQGRPWYYQSGGN